MRRPLSVFLGFVLVAAGVPAACASQLQWEDISGGNRDIICMGIDEDDPALWYAGSAHAVLGTRDAGQHWRTFLSVRGHTRAVRQLLTDPRTKGHMYAATGSGLFVSVNGPGNWRKLYKGKNYLEADCTSVALTPFGVYLGTRGGLFVSQDAGASWRKESMPIASRAVVAIAYEPSLQHDLYVAYVDTLYKTTDAGRTWEKIFALHVPQCDDVMRDEAQDDQAPACGAGIRSVCISRDDPGMVYVATSAGVYRSPDKGTGWEKLPEYGMTGANVRQVIASGKYGILAMTDSSVYVFGVSWQELSLGLLGGSLQSMTLDARGCLYVAGSHGLWRAQLEDASRRIDTRAGLAIYFQGEPSVRRLQEAAIAYADVRPEKIMAWKKSASRRAWLPQVSCGINQDAADLWHWETGSSTKTGDDALQRGRATVEWDLRLVWELGDLIWNNEQTSIDSRAKLMVELRDELVDEVTKLYFERIRVKIELDALKIEDTAKRTEKELKLRELTASLDGLTGGYFSDAQALRKPSVPL